MSTRAWVRELVGRWSNEKAAHVCCCCNGPDDAERGARVIAVSRSQEKLDLARRLGAEHTVVAGPDAAEALVELTGAGPRVRRHIRAGSVVSRLPRASMDT